MGKPSHMDLIVDPLLILRVDRSAWRSPVLVQILLQILSTYPSISKNNKARGK